MAPSPGGTIYPVEVRDGVVRGTLEGPDNPLLKRPEKVRADFVASIDASHAYAKIAIGGQERLLRVGEWSDWVPMTFELAWGQIRAQCRFYLKQVTPDFALYVSPLNLDPLSPALPVSTPGTYAADLARATGRFYTQGMPEDTKSLKTGVLTAGEFLEQARIAADETERQYRYVLDRFTDGFLFYYFGNVDQVSHMMWRAMDPQHPAYDPKVDPQYRSVVEDLYVEMDAIVGRTLSSLGPDDLLVVMSDHGFASWRRAFNLNTWLRDNGYLTLRQRRRGAPASVIGRYRLVPDACLRAGAQRALHQPPGTRVVGYRRSWRAGRAGARNRRQAAADDRPSDGNPGRHPHVSPRGGLHARPATRTSPRTSSSAMRKGRGHQTSRRSAACRRRSSWITWGRGPGITAWIPTRCRASS